MIEALYIAWQDPETRLWHTVGQLRRQDALYRFDYTRGARASSRFKYLGRMLDLDKSYYSHELFPLFSNRILNSSRPEYPDYVRWLAMNPDIENDPMQLLARSGGQRATDELYIYSQPEINNLGEMELFFLSNGLRYLDKSSLERVLQLKSGDRLILNEEDDNTHDSSALRLETDDRIKAGYCPRYLNKDLRRIMKNTKVALTVERLNPNAPIQFRLLCKAVFTLPHGYKLFEDEECKPLTLDESCAA